MQSDTAIPGHILKQAKTGSVVAARIIAKAWATHGDHHMKALATGQEWSSYKLTEEAEQAVESLRRPVSPSAKAELKALLAFARSAPTPYVFWSTYGHTFSDCNGYGTCDSCGGEWELVHDQADNLQHGRYRANDGSDPTECPRHSVTHGEAPCSNPDHDSLGEQDKLVTGEPCPDCTAECNDLFCS